MSNSQNNNNILSNISTILKISCAVIDSIDHSLNENKSPNSDRKKENTRNCKFFNSGRCKYGDKCKFKHSV